MLFRWLRNRRRRRLLETPFPNEWRNWLEDNVFHYSQLDAETQSRLRDLIQIFVAEKHWEGLSGLTITWEIQVTIAALACLLIVEREGDLAFDHVLSILVYPDMFLARGTQTNPVGVVTEGREARLGEAWYRGPVILSWEDSLADARYEEPGFNVVLHEFAHQLDMLSDRHVDGTPPHRNRQEYDDWVSVMTVEFERLRDRCRHRQPSPIDCYGMQNPAEFFAVATEAFFERPHALRHYSPELYGQLQNFYNQDPAGWDWSGVAWSE